MNSTLSAITKKGMDQFQEQHADFFALLSEPPNKVFERLGAAIVLDAALQEKFKEYGSVENICCPDPNFRKSRQQMFIALLHQSLAQKLIKLASTGTVQFAVQPTPEGLEQYNHLEMLSGTKPFPVPPPPPKTAAELLRSEVLDDFNGVKGVKPPLSTKAMQEKRRTRREYDAEYRRLADTDALASAVTSGYSGSDMIGS